MDLAHLQQSVWPLLEQVYGLPSGVLNAIAGVETGGTYNPLLVNRDAKGLFQIRPIALQQLKIDTGIDFDPFSPGAASAAAALLLRRQLRMFRGDVSLALAGYNAGEGRIRQFVLDNQQQGSGTLPATTVNYIAKVRRLM